MQKSIAASLIPSLLWMVFVKHYHVLVLSTPFHPLEIWGRILHPNTAFLLLALKSMWGLDQNMVYVLGLSILILGVTRNPIWKIMIPAFLWIASWFFYYAYIYCYPDGRGDYLSGLRYLMPVTLVMYWAAAVAYQESIDHLLMKTASWVWMVQLLPIIFVVMLIFFRKIYMFG